jgi:hypothetical protein
MFYAKERRTEKIVPAAKASLYGDYRCPTCKAEVFLKRGEIYRNHFAHMPGQGKPECDDYHPPEDLRRQWQTSTGESKDLPVEGLSLGIELEPEVDTHGPRKWGLRLTVPKSHDGRGEVRIDLGGGDIRKIALATLSLGARSYRAHPPAPDFGAVWVSPEVPATYRAAVEHRIVGFSANLATVFSAVPQKLKPQTNALRWGESYYFVWRNDMRMAFPESLNLHTLAENLGWRCSLAALPDKADPEIAAWLAKICDLQIARAKREWALVYPPPYAIDDDGNVQVATASKLLLAIKPIDSEHEAAITCQAGQQLHALRLKNSNHSFVQLVVTEHAKALRIHLAWDGMALNSLVAKPYPEIAEPAVLLEFEGGSARRQAFMHHAMCDALLMQVRRNESRLSAIHAPTTLPGQLRSRRAGQLEWDQEELTFASPRGQDVSASVDQIARINGALQDKQRDVSLDFGAFGSFIAHAIAEAKARPAVYRIPRGLRGRIEWLCKASGAFVDGRHRPLNVLDDSALVSHLSSFPSPAWLVVHRRAVEHELRNKVALP